MTRNIKIVLLAALAGNALAAPAASATLVAQPAGQHALATQPAVYRQVAIFKKVKTIGKKAVAPAPVTNTPAPAAKKVAGGIKKTGGIVGR